MSRSSIIFSALAVAGILAFGMQQGQAASDVDGMDHSKLNYGVLGQETHHDTHADDHQHASVDMSDVGGMDHSKLNHGVLGAAAPAPTPEAKLPASSNVIKWQSPK
jgi:hypothetical protein